MKKENIKYILMCLDENKKTLCGCENNLFFDLKTIKGILKRINSKGHERNQNPYFVILSKYEWSNIDYRIIDNQIAENKRIIYNNK